MRWVRLGVVSIALVTATGCRSSSLVDVSSPPSPSGTTQAPPTSTESPTAVTSPPPQLPAGVPASYPKNSEPGDIPLAALIPADARLSGSWFANQPGGSADILVAYSVGADPFHQIHGMVEWKRFDARPFWRATFGLSYPASAGVLGIAALIGDSTGDGLPDALTFASTGGSGACGVWSVIDLAASAQIFDRTLCDSQIILSKHPIGLTMTQAIFRPTDPHCCPSSTRTTVLTWNGSTWTISSQELTSNAGTVSPTPS